LPTWGLTKAQRNLRPWGLDPKLLDPAKVTTDPVERDVYTTFLEQAIIDTAPFQRLRRVRQLGATHLVYPGATHTRFSHSLGALRVAQDLLDGVMQQREGLHPSRPDLIEQWFDSDSNRAEEQIAEATVLARLGALVHDLGHIAFGHAIEDDLHVLIEHDKNLERFRKAWAQIATTVRARTRRELGRAAQESLETLFSANGVLRRQLQPLVVSKGKGVLSVGQQDYPFVADLVGNTICADLLDYLLRDHLFTGLPASLGRRFTTAFFVVPANRGPYSKRLALNIYRSGHERTDVVTELLKALRYRYELSERVLVHHAKLVGDAMVGKVLELHAEGHWLEEAASVIGALDDSEAALRDANPRRARSAVEAHDARAAAAARQRVRRRLEAEFLRYGDDGLLERIADLGRAKSERPRVGEYVDTRRRQASDLAEAYLARRLFKIVGRVGSDAAPAAALYKQYGETPDRRVELQDAAQRFAELGADPKLLIWLPDPAMRLKLAEVLVDDGRHIDRFVDYERARGGRGSEIYDAHQRLWGLWVFMASDVSDSARQTALAYLARELGVCWERMRDHFGDRSADWVDRLALSRILKVQPRDRNVEQLISTAATLATRGHRGDTFSDHLDLLRSSPEIRRARRRQR
jgi:HD superfamily phosphohydrolase